MKKINFFSLLFVGIFGTSQIFAQPANTCPSVSAPPQTVCGGCVNETMTFLPVNATTSYGVASVPYLPYSYTTNPSTGTTPASALPTNIDDYWSPVLNIGFCFQFYGNTYTQCIVGSNGGISFNTANASGSNTWPISGPIPSATPADMENSIMGPWQDIDPAITPASGTSDVFYYTTGTAPCRKFVAVWHNTPMFSCTTLIDQQEIVLYETTNIIEVYIQSKPLCSGWNGGLAVLGIQNSTGTSAVAVPGRNATQWSATNEGWRFTPSGAPLYTLKWLQGATLVATGATASLCPAVTTTYTAEEDVTTCSGTQVFTSPVTITVSSTTPAPTTAPVTYCQGAVASPLTATPSGGGTLNWYGTSSSGGTASGTAPTPSTATPGTTNYYVSQTIGGCEGPRGVIPVTINPKPTVTVNSPTICAGSAATLTAAGATTYLWNTGSTANPLSVSPAATTSYTVTGTSLGCSNTAVSTVTVNPVPTVSVNSATICAGSSTTLTATPSTGGGTYSWTPGGATTAAITVSPGSTTTYTVTYTLSGCSNTGTGTVTVNPLPTITVNSPTICAGSSATLTAVGGTTYLWNTGSTANPLTVSPAVTTTYTVTGTTAGCSSTAISTVTVNPIPVVSVNSPTICAGSAATLTATGATTYLWNTGSTANPLSVSPATTTTYTVTGTSLGCSSTATSTVTVNPVPTITVNSPTICPTTSATLTAAGGTTYLWSTGSTANPLVVSPAATTSYTVTGTTAGCSSTAVATVTIGGSVSITVNSSTICAGQSATMTATGASTYLWNTGSTANPLTVSPAATTTYTVTGTSAGCTGTATATITVNPIPVVAVNSATICDGSSATLTATGATSYVWDSGSTANPLTVSPTTTTTYTVTGTSLGCSSTATSTVTVNPIPTITVNSPTICPTTSATLTAAGGTTYLWSTGSTANPLVVSPASTTSYTVTGTSLGCSNTAVATVSIAPSIVISVNSPTICAGSAATLTASGATTYTWSTGSTANPLVISPATTTSYTVTGNTGGCTGTAVSTVTVNPLPVVTVNSPTICAGTTAVLTAAGATSYAWNTGSTANPLSVSPAATTTYTVIGTSLGCSDSAVATVTVNPIPVVTVNSPSICPGTSATLTAAGATTYSWNTGSTANPLVVSPATNTSYTVTGTSLGCSDSAIATVTINAALIPNAGLDDSICFGGSTTLNVTPNGAGYTYSWTPAAGLSSTSISNPVASPAVTTTYSVTVTDPSGCSGTDNVTIYADPQITVAKTAFNVTCNGACNGQTIVIPGGGAGGFTYLWTSGCTTASCTGLCPGTYSVTITDAWGCTATADTVITQPPLLVASVTGTTPVTCNGLCDGTATASAVGGTTPYTYSWNTTPVQTVPNATGLCAGNYICTVTDANSCSDTVHVTITQPALVVIAPISNASICFGGSTTLTASASGGNPGGYTYTWTPSTGLSSTTVSNPTANPTVTTVYTVNASDVAHSCPAAPVTVTVTVGPALNVNATGPAPICLGTSGALNAIATNGNSGPYTYSWSPSTGLSNAAISNPVANPVVTTTYTVTANDGCSPAVTDTITVIVLPLPVVIFNSDVTSGCAPLCVNFTNNSTVAGGGTIASSSWSFSDGGSATGTPVSHCFTNPGLYSVSLTTTSASGCVSSLTNTDMITVNAVPVPAFTAPESTSVLNPFVQFTDNSTGATSWSWNFGDMYDSTGTGNTSTVQNPIHEYTQEGFYCVTLIVTNASGCTDSILHCLTIDPEFTFYIPNAFSPNGDGINDEFFGKGENIAVFEMDIFDRWGNLIFYSDNINKHWDGTANHGSEIVQQDSYVYVVKITDNKNMKHKYLGSVTIVK